MVVRLISNFKTWLVENSCPSMFSLPCYLACNFMGEEEECYRRRIALERVVWKEWVGVINAKET